jgi:uncharacterized integral membrane protein
MKFFSIILSFILIVAAVVFALSNGQAATVNLWPSDITVTAPLALWMLGSLVFGLFFGGLFVWLQSLPHRFKMRRLGKDVVALADRLLQAERELDHYRAKSVTQDLVPQRPAWKFWSRH